MTMLHSSKPEVRKISNLADWLILAGHQKVDYEDPALEAALVVALARIHLQKLYRMKGSRAEALALAQQGEMAVGASYAMAVQAQIDDYIAEDTNG